MGPQRQHLTQPPQTSGADDVLSFVRKLRHGVRLTVDDETVLSGLLTATRLVERGDIQRDGTEPTTIILILEGWLCRCKRCGDDI